MSDDGGSSGSDVCTEDCEDGTMEIVVETLTGTTFEMTVAPTDTVGSIKNKIQRVEGIPVSQQHLLYRWQELANEARLSEHGVSAGCTLRLVLSMRGGPISTRRLPSTEHHLAWRELKEYVDTTREDMMEKLPPGAKVTVLLFRDGEHINLIRVIENEDGTCYPYSDAWPAAKGGGREAPHTKYRERSGENHALMHKVAELRRKMEGLSMQKRARKPAGEEARPGGPCTSADPRPRPPPDEGLRMGKSLSEIYSDRLLLLEQRRNSRSNIGRSHRPHRVDGGGGLSVKADARACSLSTPSIAILEEEPESGLAKKPAEFAPASPIGVASGAANAVTVASLPGAARNLLRHHHVVLRQRAADRPQSSPEQDAQQFCNALFSEAGQRNRRPSLEYAANGSGGPRVQCANSLEPAYSRAVFNGTGSNLLTSQFASTSKLNSAHLDSVLGGRVTDGESRRVPVCGRRARIERMRNHVAEGGGPGPDKFGYSNLGYMANIEKVQNESADRHLGTGVEALPRRKDAPSGTCETLPAIGPAKKPVRTRCAQCHKRLNITTVHTCRCGGTFCSQHRYSEVHGCHYDYKTEGRKILERANPLVAAPKLPKI